VLDPLGIEDGGWRSVLFCVKTNPYLAYRE